MSADVFAPLREMVVAWHNDNPASPPALWCAERSDLLARLLREHAERGEALKDIAANYDHDELTRDHRKGYGGFCRVCTAERSLSSSPHPTDNQ